MFFAACEGYFDKMEDQQRMFRRLATIVHQTWGGKMKEQQLWPLKSDKKHDVIKKVWGSKEEALAMIKKIEESHGIKLRHE